MEINTQILELLLGGETLVTAALAVTTGYLLSKIKAITGAPQAYAVLKGRVKELRDGEQYELLAQLAGALVNDGGDDDEASMNLAKAFNGFLEDRGFFGKENV